MPRFRRAYRTTAVGRWGGQRQPALIKHGAHHRMGRAPQRDGRQSCRHRSSYWRIGSQRQNHGQGPRPERRRQLARRRIEQCESLCLLKRGNVNDQRVEIGAPLGAVDRRDCLCTVSPGSKAINRLGWHRDRPASRQAVNGQINPMGIGRDYSGRAMCRHRCGAIGEAVHCQAQCIVSAPERLTMNFVAPVEDQLFALNVCAGIAEIAQADRFAAASEDVVSAIVSGIGDFAAGEWAPLNRVGDQQGSVLRDGKVQTPDGFAAAYHAYVENGWNAIAGAEEFGGQGLPFSLACCVLESLGGANMAFTLLPMLTVGAIEALQHHGSEAQQAAYLPRLVSGEWSGTMNLTEPQAGSDVGALRTTATPIADGPHAGKYAIAGSKIFITWGEHELAENIIHLVLARTPDAPAGSRGISLFVVPKFLLDAEGQPGERNDLRVVSLEHKLGIHASPTCVMSFGDNGACIGELVGHENGGLRAMFTMMNSARINVGSQGVQIAEQA